MIKTNRQNILVVIVTASLLLASMSAQAFRCGRKLVIENMHEAQVIKACGAPTTSRDLGFTTRSTFVPIKRSSGHGISTEHYPGYGQLEERVVLTEYVYNFGPRKFMQRLLFEGGVLVTIETIGYGYHETKSK